MVIRARGIKSALAGGTHDAVQHLLGVGPALGAVAAAHLADDHRGVGWSARRASWWCLSTGYIGARP